MHTRERGAAHVNIFFFLIVLVLFLGAVGFGYTQMSDKNGALEARIAAEEALARERNQRQLYELYKDDLTSLLGEAGTYERADFKFEGPQPRPIENATLPAKVRALVKQFGAETGVPETLSKGLSSLLAAIKTTIDAKDKRIRDLEALTAKLSADKNAAEAAVAEANRQKTAEVASLNQKHSELRQYVDSEYRKKENRIRGLQAEIAKRIEELNSEREKHAQDVLALRKELNLLKARIDAQTNLTRLINPPQEPDGRVISSSQAAGRAWIDLGRKDMLPRGITFRISSPDDDRVKAYGTVVRVEADRAEIRITGLRDRLDPVVKGDLVRNDLYSPHVRRNVYLLGRFTPPLTKPVVKTILESYGNRVHDKIGPGVDLVIVGGDTVNEEGDGFTPITEHEDYKQALFLGIEIATLNKVRDFLRVSSE